ncbi:MAG: hypothetical protein LUC92_03850 [Clostridiales bacterium]|nr:hypothetical protein [Clostridiales bacterium]
MKIKKILALLTSTAMLAASLNVSAFATVGPGSGDVNDDGSVTKADANLTMEYVLNPASTSITAYKDLIEAQGDVTGYDCENDCGITAKDVAMILQMVAEGSLPASIYATAGKLAEGANVFRPIEWDGTTEDAARLSAQKELETLSVDDFFDKYFGDVENTARADQINNFLDKVYLNDYKLTDSACEAWILSILDDTGNSELTTFVSDFYTALDGGLEIEEAKELFHKFNDVTITDADINAIEANADVEEFKWFRTNFQIVVYDADTYDSDSIPTTIKHYDDHYSNYGISVVDWYFFNNSEVIPRIAAMGFNDYSDTVYGKYASPTDEQPFKDNVIATLRNIVKPYLDVVNADGTVKAALDAIGGDRVEFTINTGTLPEVVDKGDTIESYDDFVKEFGSSWDDPCTTYYVDFSQVGYDFSSGSGSSDVSTTTTEAATETTTAEDATTTEAATITTEAQGEETTYVLNPASSADTAAANALLYQDSSVSVYAGPYGAVATKRTDGTLVWQLTNANGDKDTLATAVVDGTSYSGKFRNNCTAVAAADGSVTVTIIAQSAGKTFAAFEYDEATATYNAVASCTIADKDGEGALTWTAKAGTTYYIGGNGTNPAILLPNATTGSSDATTTTEASAETTTDSATTTTEASAETTTDSATTTTEASGETTTTGNGTAVSLTVTKNTNGNDGITITETDGTWYLDDQTNADVAEVDFTLDTSVSSGKVTLSTSIMSEGSNTAYVFFNLKGTSTSAGKQYLLAGFGSTSSDDAAKAAKYLSLRTVDASFGNVYTDTDLVLTANTWYNLEYVIDFDNDTVSMTVTDTTDGSTDTVSAALYLDTFDLIQAVTNKTSTTRNISFTTPVVTAYASTATA